VILELVLFSFLGVITILCMVSVRGLLSALSSNMFINFCCHSQYCLVSTRGNEYSVSCAVAPSATVSLQETKCYHFSEFTFFDFLLSTKIAPAVHQHITIHLELDFFNVYSSRSVILLSSTQVPLVGCDLSQTDGLEQREASYAPRVD
jgi:hypothetical protein